ncbi:MAG: DUF499 domain-containing protein [Candidatus Nitrosocaldus sp.]
MVEIPNIWQVCTFVDEIITGTLNESKFAVELHSILDNSADDVYKNPSIFLSNTYLTGNMKGILKSVLLRLARNEGSPVYILDTEFGGGKTHTLLLLYHIFSNRDLGSNYISYNSIDKETGVLEVPDVKVVALDCRSVKKKTLWGEIAYLLNSYESVRQHDENREPIQQIEVIKQWFTRRGYTPPSSSDTNNPDSSYVNKPVLLLIDELPHYLLEVDSIQIGNVTLAELTISFIQKLISAVSSVNNCILVITITGKQTLYERYRDKVAESIEQIMNSLKQSVSRQSTIIVPINKEDVYSVIVKRLVKSINWNRLRSSRLIEEYEDYYQKKNIIDDPNYKARLEKAYPFHPFFIDILYERVSTIESFNKTRSILKFLATVLHNIYLNKRDVKLVSIDSIDLSDYKIKDFIATLKGGLMPVIESDCIKHAKELDSKKNIKIVEPIAKAILLYSLIGSSKESGIGLRELKLAVCKPSMDDSIVDNAIQEIDESFWYIKKTPSNEYLLTVKPNINKIIYDFMQEIRDAEIKDKIEAEINHIIDQDSTFKVIYGDKYGYDEDKPELKIVIIDYENIENKELQRDSQGIKQMLKDMLEYTSTRNIRNYQNTLVFLYPSINGIDHMKYYAKRVIACEKAEKSNILTEKEDINMLKKKLSDEKNNFVNIIKNAYTNIAYPHVHDIRLMQIDIIKNKNIIEAVKSKLSEYGKLLKDEEIVNPDLINAMLTPERPLKVEEIFELFMKDRSKPFISRVDPIVRGIARGVEEGLFGYANELNEINGKYIAEIGNRINVSSEGYVIKKEYIEEGGKDKKIVEAGLKDDLDSIRRDNGRVKDKVYLGSYNCTHPLPIHNIDKCLRVLQKLPLLFDDIKEKYIDFELIRGNDKITIHNELKDINELRSLIQQLKASKYYGNGKLTIIADKDITNKLKELE